MREISLEEILEVGLDIAGREDLESRDNELVWADEDKEPDQ